MPPRFLSISDATLDGSGRPWITSIDGGLKNCWTCARCEAIFEDPEGDLQVRVDAKGIRSWPDALGCGHASLLVVSERVVEAWHRAGVLSFRPHRVAIKRLVGRPKGSPTIPPYYWIDGSRLVGAKMDFDASGFVGVWFCPSCGARHDDVKATYIRQHALPKPPFQFVPDSWNGLALFTTDLSDCAFFCTDQVVALARQERFTNFSFVPIERGGDVDAKGVDYLGASSGDLGS